MRLRLFHVLNLSDAAQIEMHSIQKNGANKALEIICGKKHVYGMMIRVSTKQLKIKRLVV